MKTHTSRGRKVREEARIVRTPGVMGGSPRIDGHRIRVSDIVRYRDELGYSPRRIVKALPTINEDQVRVALKFYEENKAEIDEYIEREDQLFREHVNPPIPRRER